MAVIADSYQHVSGSGGGIGHAVIVLGLLAAFLAVWMLVLVYAADQARKNGDDE